MQAFWSRSEDWVLVWHDGKWWYEALYLGHRTAQGFHFVEIGDTVEAAVRAELRRRHPRVYDHVRQSDQRMPCVDLSRARLQPPVLTMEIIGGIPKEDSPLNFDGTVNFHFVGTAQNFHARLTRLHLKAPSLGRGIGQ